MSDFHSLQARAITGESVDFSSFRNQVALVVNVASKCGFTSQYEGLEALYQEYKDQGFVILGFPCNQFGHQEPGNAVEILAFCATTYKVSFPLFEKIDVNGPKTHPVYAWLKEQKPGILDTEAIKWNFTKFLIGRDGQVIDRFAPTTTPDALRKPILAALQASA
ncbi:glutathione peroxidase [Pusillimonas sp. CC-YST705]|uniref:Glutathione peroxidase n=1 Tax=Mesopusillimonas faecipullorum TaxID=2755040 RepID=A0ABS8CAN4_9BURK|nr:glutathione peroxidase [Mesopusillimonas faecipullorum]MCB5363087.1 glutathione peroxidase [Mesopusillimonas faecipullorum]